MTRGKVRVRSSGAAAFRAQVANKVWRSGLRSSMKVRAGRLLRDQASRRSGFYENSLPGCVARNLHR